MLLCRALLVQSRCCALARAHALQRHCVTSSAGGASAGGARRGCGGAGLLLRRAVSGAASATEQAEEGLERAATESGEVAASTVADRLQRGTLYVVSTPIGNLEDITLRALRVLRTADCVFAEDTRHTRALLTHYGLRTPCVSLHAHNESSRSAGVLARLAAGESLALVSDAGTPGVCDPGSLVVSAALQAGHPVVAVPGACALLAALVVAGLPTHAFAFAGFLPPQPGQRRRRLRDLAAAQGDATLLLYVPPHKAAATLADAADALGGERRCCVARELTKLHEEAWRGTLQAAAVEFAHPGRARGEFTLLIAGAQTAAADDEADAELQAGDAADAQTEVEQRLQALMAKGVSPSQAAREVAEATGVRRRDVYAKALALHSAGPDTAAL